MRDPSTEIHSIEGGSERPVDGLAAAHGVTATGLEQYAEREGCVLRLLERLVLRALREVWRQAKEADHGLHRAQLDRFCHCFRMLA